MRVSALDGHRLWASSYDSDLNPVLALEMRMLKNLLDPTRAKCCIDVACGTGRWMSYVLCRGANVFGIDACFEMLSVAERKPELHGRSALAEATCLPFANETADVALCSFAAGYLPHLNQAVGEMARIVKSAGRVIISDLHPTALKAGWTRSFRVADQVVEMEHFAPSLEEIRTAAERASLQPHIQIESSFGDPERPIFRRAGKEHILARASKIPAIWIGIWKKP